MDITQFVCDFVEDCRSEFYSSNSKLYEMFSDIFDRDIYKESRVKLCLGFIQDRIFNMVEFALVIRGVLFSESMHNWDYLYPMVLEKEIDYLIMPMGKLNNSISALKDKNLKLSVIFMKSCLISMESMCKDLLDDLERNLKTDDKYYMTFVMDSINDIPIGDFTVYKKLDKSSSADRVVDIMSDYK